jgi:hypothetical protein
LPVGYLKFFLNLQIILFILQNSVWREDNVRSVRVVWKYWPDVCLSEFRGDLRGSKRAVNETLRWLDRQLLALEYINRKQE